MLGPLRILVADANPCTRDAVTLALRTNGHDVVAPGDWPAIATALSGAFDAIVTDVVMPPLAHGEIVRHLRRAQPRVALVVISSGFLQTSRPVARAFGADIFIERPASMGAIEAAIERARLRPATAS